MALDLVENEADRERITGYVASGSHLWDRDLSLLDGVQKIETEALDPLELRAVVAEAIDNVIDTEALERLDGAEASENELLGRRLRRVAKAFGRGGRAGPM